MSPPVPFSIRALALSHARAWPTAAWTGAATALAAGLALLPTQWVLLVGLTGVSGWAIRMISAQIVGAWLALHPDVRAQLSGAPSEEPLSDYDAAVHAALRPFA
ncbi:MAG: hypothetical protein AAF845_07805 [Bacteroidota bacterium]